MVVKEIWTNSDFEIMGWHDCRIYAMSFPDEKFKFYLELDYIFKWEKYYEGYKFWVSPCHLIFENIYDLRVEMDFQDSIGLYMIEIKRLNPRLSPNQKMTIWDYIIECDSGRIFVSASGFTQIVIKQPVLSETQDLDINR